MFEFALWKLRSQLARINQLDDKIGEHLSDIAKTNRAEHEKIERAAEEQRQRELPAPAPPAPTSPARDPHGRFEPAPASPHALFKVRILAGLRGTVAPPAPATPPNPVFVQNRENLLAGLRGGR